MNSKWVTRTNMLVNIAVLVAAAIVLFHPRGPVVPRVSEWRQNYAVRGVLRESWSDLAAVDSMKESNDRVLVVFSDYQCPACKYAEQGLTESMRRNGFRVVYRHMPLTAIHSQAEDAARAAICAERQGQFDEMHTFLFQDIGWQRGEDWTETARRAGIKDLASFSSCLHDEQATARLAQDKTFAERLRVKATPTFVSPSRIHSGYPDDAQIARLLES